MTILTALLELLKDAAYNRELYRSGRADRREVRQTTVGWRPDPHECNDGMTEQRTETPSGEREYYRVIRNRKDGSNENDRR